MVQSLLEERFQLKTHREVRELPVYELTVAKAGLKIKPSNGVPEGRPRMRMGRNNPAIQEQLGLKLDSAKGPVEVLVIDSVQKPAAN